LADLQFERTELLFSQSEAQNVLIIALCKLSFYKEIKPIALIESYEKDIFCKAVAHRKTSFCCSPSGRHFLQGSCPQKNIFLVQPLRGASGGPPGAPAGGFPLTTPLSAPKVAARSACWDTPPTPLDPQPPFSSWFTKKTFHHHDGGGMFFCRAGVG